MAMAGTSHEQDTRVYGEEPTRWAGWVVFGGAMLVLVGAVHVVEGIVAFFKDDFFGVDADGLLVPLDYTAWGWFHLVMGLVAVAAGIGLLAGNSVARVAAVIIAGLSALLNLAFINAYPVYAVVVITLDVIVIYAVVTHGDELKARSY
jgi:hypothetical protein